MPTSGFLESRTAMWGGALHAIAAAANVVRHCPDWRAAVLILRQPEGRGRGLRVQVTDGCPCPPLSTAVDKLSELS